MAKTPSSYISLLYWERDNFIENGKWLIMIDKDNDNNNKYLYYPSKKRASTYVKPH